MSSNVGIKQIILAFRSGNRKRLANDHTEHAEWFYHNNRIAWFSQGTLYFSLSGWDTVTTRRRLNLLFTTLNLGISLHRVKGETKLVKNGKHHEVSTYLPYAVTDF